MAAWLFYQGTATLNQISWTHSIPENTLRRRVKGKAHRSDRLFAAHPATV